MAVRTQPQLGMDELRITDDAIEAVLVERQKRKNSLDALRVQFDEADERAKAAIANLELTEGAVRIGGFRITKTYLPSRTVQPFETKASNRIRITPIADEG